MTEEKPTVVDSTHQAFEHAVDAYVVAEAELRAATARRDAAKRAVMRARPAGVTSVAVTRRLKAAAIKAEQLVQVMVTKDHGAPRSIVIDHVTLPNVSDPEALMANLESVTRASGIGSGRG